MRLSIVMPTFQEAETVVATLSSLESLRRAGHEVIVVDGGSTDGTLELAAPHADRTLRAPRGRAAQMNAGAARAHGDVLLFLHADTRLPEGIERIVHAGMLHSGAAWGRFDVRLSGEHPLLRVVEWLMNLRSRLSGIATGDQAIFVRRDAFAAVGGFPELPLMEDIALSRALRELRQPLCLRAQVVTSSRRWERRGVVRTILLMWWLRTAYALGVNPARLVRAYERS